MQELSPLPHSAIGLDRQGLKNLKAMEILIAAALPS